MLPRLNAYFLHFHLLLKPGVRRASHRTSPQNVIESLAAGAEDRWCLLDWLDGRSCEIVWTESKETRDSIRRKDKIAQKASDLARMISSRQVYDLVIPWSVLIQ